MVKSCLLNASYTNLSHLLTINTLMVRNFFSLRFHKRSRDCCLKLENHKSSKTHTRSMNKTIQNAISLLLALPRAYEKRGCVAVNPIIFPCHSEWLSEREELVKMRRKKQFSASRGDRLFLSLVLFKTTSRSLFAHPAVEFSGARTPRHIFWHSRGLAQFATHPMPPQSLQDSS